MSDASRTEEFLPPDAARSRAHRDHAALIRVAERHASTSEQRRRYAHATVPDAYEAVSLVTALASGGAPLGADEEPLDEADLIAALTLLPRVRADVDALELGLLTLARGRGMTWQAIAFGLGLGTAQAARQRFDRLTGRTPTGDSGG